MPGGYSYTPNIWNNDKNISWDVTSWELTSGTALHIYFNAIVTEECTNTNYIEVSGDFGSSGSIFACDTVDVIGIGEE